MAIITLTTDFGTRDHYVGVMKGVIKTISPKADVVDVTHDIEPHNVVHASFVMMNTVRWFPEGSIHVAVVDPGVGSDRRVLLAKFAGRLVVVPDNGLITMLHRTSRIEDIRVVENSRYFLPGISSTFHGRDIFAPVAAHLCEGAKPKDLGRGTDRIEILPIPHRCDTFARRIRGAVLYVDRFGTMVTNIHRRELQAISAREDALEVQVNDQRIGVIRGCYQDVPVGEPLAVIGSTDYLEIAVNQGRAVDRFGPAGEVRVEVS
jgi:hypothetical protein